MMHTGDIYEERARTARHRELRAFASVLSGLLFHVIPGRKTKRVAGFSSAEPANDRVSNRRHAA